MWLCLTRASCWAGLALYSPDLVITRCLAGWFVPSAAQSMHRLKGMGSGGQLRGSDPADDMKSRQGDTVFLSLPPLLPPPTEKINIEHLQGTLFSPWNRGKELGPGSEGGHSLKAFASPFCRSWKRFRRWCRAMAGMERTKAIGCCSALPLPSPGQVSLGAGFSMPLSHPLLFPGVPEPWRVSRGG